MGLVLSAVGAALQAGGLRRVWWEEASARNAARRLLQHLEANPEVGVAADAGSVRDVVSACRSLGLTGE